MPGDSVTKGKKNSGRGLVFRRILKTNFLSQSTELVLLDLKPGLTRNMHLETGGFACTYLIDGNAAFDIAGDSYILGAGDTLLFNCHLKHKMKNPGRKNARLLTIHLC